MPAARGKPGGWWRVTGMVEITVFAVLTILLAAGVAGVRVREPSLMTTIQVAVGSEDMGFFPYPQAMTVFASNGFTVVAVPMGSRQMAQNAKTLRGAGYNALFPSSEDFAQEIQQQLSSPYGNQQPFSTPLAVFTWRDLLSKLETEQ